MDNQKANSDIEILKLLLPYWNEHNNKHVEYNRKWLKKTEDAGLKDVAEELKRIIQLSEEINRCIESAIKKLKIMGYGRSICMSGR